MPPNSMHSTSSTTHPDDGCDNSLVDVVEVLHTDGETPTTTTLDTGSWEALNLVHDYIDVDSMGDTNVTEEDICEGSAAGRIPVIEEDNDQQTMDATFGSRLHSNAKLHNSMLRSLAAFVEHGVEMVEDEAKAEAMWVAACDELLSLEASSTAQGVDVNAKLRPDDPNGITILEVAYFLLKEKLNSGSSREQSERIARVCNLLNGGLDSQCPYTMHQLREAVSVEGVGKYLVHVCPRYCKVFDMEKDGDDEHEVCGVNGCTERRYSTRSLSNGERKKLVPTEFLIYFGLKRAIQTWLQMPEFWSLRSQKDARSHLDFWSGQVVLRMDAMCGGDVLREHPSAEPRQHDDTCQYENDDGESWMERHGCCIEIGHDHFPIFSDRKR